MTRPADVDELCDRLNAYFENLTDWLNRIRERLNDLEEKVGGHQTDEPPPPPPELT